MFTYVTENDFVEAFRTWQSGQYKDNFSYDGLKALYADFEEYENSTGEKIELDVIAICCEHSEYESIEEFNNAYGKDWTLEELKDHTHVIEFMILSDAHKMQDLKSKDRAIFESYRSIQPGSITDTQYQEQTRAVIEEMRKLDEERQKPFIILDF